MATPHQIEPRFEPIHPTLENSNNVSDDRPTQTRIRIKIPQKYHQEPVISRLISDHKLTVNLNQALLGANASNDGWFDLDLQGSTRQIQSALIYLAEMDIEIWSKSTDPEEEIW
ncbi:NIL domain-containing protein [Aerosakkonemataceae cyanobacterium BLCC-F50]|uniref:NIL domain-containing protein n=1 Tax=Floridaenema flaviceps BLCC-F50 TaxID=3153642 RepID=A0ABV4XVW6_9CYAN